MQQTLSEPTEKLKKRQNGGARPNSGRKKFEETIEYEQASKIVRTHAFEKVGKKIRLVMVLDQLFDEAMDGDMCAIKEYLDRQLGRAKESMDVKSDGEKITGIVYVRHGAGPDPETGTGVG